MISEFQGDYRWLSNFYYSPITYNNLLYPTVEHFFQAMKTTDLSARAKICLDPNPGSAKRTGRTLQLRPDWDSIKIAVMAHGLRKKFAHPDLKQKLIATYPLFIEEGNYWHDNYWGNCLCPKCNSFAGRNNLGQLLMILREHLINGTLADVPDPVF
jgi:hypothetical protein